MKSPPVGDDGDSRRARHGDPRGTAVEQTGPGAALVLVLVPVRARTLRRRNTAESVSPHGAGVCGGARVHQVDRPRLCLYVLIKKNRSHRPKDHRSPLRCADGAERP